MNKLDEGFFKNYIEDMEIKIARKIYDKHIDSRKIPFGRTVLIHNDDNSIKAEQIDSYNRIVRRRGLDQKIRVNNG